jgi:biotin transport system ATP-binding protein
MTTPTVETPTISFVDLHLSLQGKPVLNGLSYVGVGRRIGIVGRNGSGKSTMARVMAGLVTPTKGKVHLCGVDVAKDRKAALGTVGILFQNPDHQIIFPTVVEEIAFGLGQQGQSRQNARASAERVLDDFGKSHWRDVSIATLSQGQKHLLCLMSVMAMQPKVLILDEPFAGLDIPTKLQLKGYLDRYDGALVHISHDPGDLQDYDELVWLDKGRIRQTGSAHAVLGSYLQEMTSLGGQDDISDLAG